MSEQNEKRDLMSHAKFVSGQEIGDLKRTDEPDWVVQAKKELDAFNKISDILKPFQTETKIKIIDMVKLLQMDAMSEQQTNQRRMKCLQNSKK